jgi:hypothetical protein
MKPGVGAAAHSPYHAVIGKPNDSNSGEEFAALHLQYTVELSKV